MKLFKFCFVLLFVKAAFGQTNAQSPPDFPALQQALDINRVLWESVSSSRYQMTLRRSCFCLIESLGPFDLIIDNNQVVSQTPQLDFDLDLPTVEDLFDSIQEAIDDEVAVLTTSYDPTLGFPSSVFIDRDFRLADEEIGYEVSDVKFLSTPKPEPSSCTAAEIRDRFSRLDIFRAFFGSKTSPIAFIRALRNWSRYAAGVGCTYTYRLTRSSFSTPDFVGPFRISVVDGVVVSAINENPNVSVQPNPSSLPTITELFMIILDEASNADAVAITFDPVTGVPTNAAIDRIKLAIDDEITFIAELL